MRATDAARVVREGDALRFHGPVLRDRVATLWLAAIPLLADAATLDLGGVTELDSAGLALFGELMQRIDSVPRWTESAGALLAHRHPDPRPRSVTGHNCPCSRLSRR